MRKWLKKDLVEFKGERMSLAQYNATHKRKFTLEQVYGKKYVASLTPEDIAGFDSFENTMSIEPGLPDDEHTRLATLFAQAFYSEDMLRMVPFLDDQVRMISYRKRTVTGKSAFLDYWEGVLSRIKDDGQVSDIKVKMNSFYGHAVVAIKQKDTDEAYVFFHIDSGKIMTAVITPVQQQPSMVRYYNLDRPRLDYDSVIMQKGEAIAAEPNRMPCLLCGTLSENLHWYKLEVDSGPFSHIGQVSICPHCKAQTEYYPEVFLRKKMEDSFRLHQSTVPHLVQDNPFIDVFVRFQTELVKAYEMAETNKENIDDCRLFEILLVYKTDPRYHLGLKLPETGSFGDICKLYTFDDEGNTYGIFDKIAVERSEMGAWNAFLLSIAHTLLPTVWHGGYERRTYILSLRDLKALFNGHGIELQQSMIESLPPKVRRGNADATDSTKEYNFFLSVVFPDSELMIMDYNRVVKDLNGYDKETFLSKISERFNVSERTNDLSKPSKKGDIYMYLDDKCFCLSLKSEYLKKDPIGILDVSVLQENLLGPILDITDPKTDSRIDFVGGIRGVEGLKDRLSKDARVAFAMYPTSLSELFDVADAGLLMPPKSTWFEPKLLSGLFIHEI